MKVDVKKMLGECKGVKIIREYKSPLGTKVEYIDFEFNGIEYTISYASNGSIRTYVLSKDKGNILYMGYGENLELTIRRLFKDGNAR